MLALKRIVIFIAFFFIKTGFCQNADSIDIKAIDRLISEENYSEAKALTLKHIDHYISNNQFYEVSDYAYYLGVIDSKAQNKDSAIKTVTDFEHKIYSLTDNLKALRQLSLEIGSFYEAVGDSKTAADYNHKALKITKSMPNAKGSDLGLIQSNLGVFYSRLGDITTGASYHKKALESYKTDPDTEPSNFYITYNSLGGMMWYASKFDSAVVYYKKADKILKTLEQTPWNKYYRPASLNNNIAGIYSIQGNMDAALQAMQKTINNLNAFLKEDISEIRRNHASEFLFQAIDNYGGLHKDIKDYKKAEQLIRYAYELKKQHLAKESPEVAKGKVLLGQIHIPLKNYEEAETFLNEGIADFKNMPGDYTYWLADALYHKGILKMETDSIASAKLCFIEAEHYYKASLGDYYDEVYLDFVVNASNFYAQTNDEKKALEMAEEGYSYIVANQGKNTLLEYYQLLNLADIHYTLEDYNRALEKSKSAIDLLNSDVFKANSRLNRLQIDSKKVSAVLIKVKSEYHLQESKTVDFLKRLLEELNTAIIILEEQKSFIADDSASSILLQDNNELFALAKQINLELYELTNTPVYLTNILGIHESLIYNKIRQRLNSKSAKLTASLPEAIIKKEQELKNALNQSLNSTEGGFNDFLDKEKQWITFLSELKKEHPNYYQLRYASISQSLDDITSNIPKATTLVRYIYVKDELYAFIINTDGIRLHNIDTVNLNTQLETLNKKIEYTEPVFDVLYNLYHKLWQPFIDDIKHQNVIILPDRDLFNLSFEMLTNTPTDSYKNLIDNCLLSNYKLSYNYSLFLIEKESQPIGYTSNFIAFAPEFNDAMKASYKISVKDSIDIDHNYLTLLPQPFAKDLAKDYSELFNGASFLNENASKQLFTSNAKEHKIIHIGTHAESDNVSPELSRLIFAKDTDSQDNSLYTYEIYNHNLASNLAILTACETGKPTYQSGEGMISLAHAFNYAGSESILTSLWKIDEQSSTKIIKYFYDNISDGQTKNEALQNAKLKYLSKAEGRTIAPQYWAGLVLIGDTSPIDISNSDKGIWLIASIIIAIILLYITRKKTIK